MTKLVVLCLVFSMLLTVSHRTYSEGDDRDVIVKDGHRVVVVEYDVDGEINTRVLILPPGKGWEEEEEEKKRDEGEVFAKNNMRETASLIHVEKQREHHVSPLELIGDAIGKCKPTMATVFKTVNDLTAETPSETVARAAREVKVKLAHEAQYAKEKVARKAHVTTDKVNERVKKKAQRAQNLWNNAKRADWGVWSAVAAALTKIGSVVDLIGISAAYGMCIWVTFVSSYVLSPVLGKQQFGVVRSKVYPVYFKAVSVGILVGLLGHIISRRRKVLTDTVEMWQAVNLLTSILTVEANASFVEPRATKRYIDVCVERQAMIKRIKAEKEEGRSLYASESKSGEAAARTSGKKVVDEEAMKLRLTKLSERLSRLKTYSSGLNFLTVMSLTWHFVYLSHRLRLTC